MAKAGSRLDKYNYSNRRDKILYLLEKKKQTEVGSAWSRPPSDHSQLRRHGTGERGSLSSRKERRLGKDGEWIVGRRRIIRKGSRESRGGIRRGGGGGGGGGVGGGWGGFLKSARRKRAGRGKLIRGAEEQGPSKKRREDPDRDQPGDREIPWHRRESNYVLPTKEKRRRDERIDITGMSHRTIVGPFDRGERSGHGPVKK